MKMVKRNFFPCVYCVHYFGTFSLRSCHMVYLSATLLLIALHVECLNILIINKGKFIVAFLFTVRAVFIGSFLLDLIGSNDVNLTCDLHMILLTIVQEVKCKGVYRIDCEKETEMFETADSDLKQIPESID